MDRRNDHRDRDSSSQPQTDVDTRERNRGWPRQALVVRQGTYPPTGRGSRRSSAVSSESRFSGTTDCGALKVDVPEAVGRARHVRGNPVFARGVRICGVSRAALGQQPQSAGRGASRASSGPCQEGGGRQKRQPRRRPCHSMPSSISETSGSTSPVPRASYAARIASIAIA